MRLLESRSVTRDAHVDSFAPVRPHDLALQLLSLERHARHEYLCDHVDTKFYLDYDEVIDIFDDDNIDKLVADRLAAVRSRVEVILDGLRHLVSHGDLKQSRLQYAIAHRHGTPHSRLTPTPAHGLDSHAQSKKFKVSFRPFIRGVRLPYTIIPEILTAYGQHTFWDMSVYKQREQLLAAINGVKSPDDPRVLQKESPDDPDEWYVAQIVSPDDISMQRPPESTQLNSTLQHSDFKDSDFKDSEFIADVLACLGTRRVEDYSSWRNVCFALKLHSEDLLDAFLQWSRSSDKYDSPDHQDAARKLWDSVDSLARLSRDSKLVTLGTVCMWAKQDDPVKYAAAKCRHHQRRIETPHSTQGVNATSVVQANEDDPARYADAQARRRSPNSSAAIAHPVKNIIHVPLEDVQQATAAIVEALGLDKCIEKVLKVFIEPDPTGAKDKGAVHMELLVGRTTTHVTLHLDTLKLTRDGVQVGYLHQSDERGIPVVNCDLAGINHHLKPGMKWVTTRPSDDNLKFTSHDTPRAHIHVLNYLNPNARSAMVNLVDINKTATVKTTKTLDMLIDAYSGSVRNALTDKLGLGNVLLVNNMHVVINNVNGPADEQRHTDEQLAVVLVREYPVLKERVKFAPDARTANCNGLFYCDPGTNVWAKRHNAVFEQMLIDMFRSDKLKDTLSPSDRRHVESRRGRNDMLYSIATKVIDESFLRRLDENADLFAIDNGCFDCSSGIPTFRALRPDDCVATTAGWSYSAEDAASHRDEVTAFFETILPVPAERRVILSFFASLLSGRRVAKKFLALTDRRSGNNGKSTLLSLMSSFFGQYALLNTKFVCKGSFDRDRDSHDAGTEPFKGKRLVIAEELKHAMTLDDAMLKRLAGGPGVTVSGRRCGSSEQFSFTWQAGFALVFNEGDCPKFDAGDAAFMARMIVAPMRAKFVDLQVSTDLQEPWTFRVDPDMGKKFPQWLSSAADILAEHFDAHNLLSDLPADMTEWKQEVTSLINPVSSWFDDNVVVTHLPSDVIHLNRDIIRMCETTVPYRDFNRYAKAHFASLGLAFKEKHNGERNVVLGCKWK